MANIAQNLAGIHQQMAAALERAGRAPDEARLVAVTKHRSIPATLDVIAAGESILGENRIQEARDKIPQIDQDVSWHFIGHLQSNKARIAAQLFDMIQSVDSERLAAALEREAARLDKRLELLVQLNIAGEQQKHGLASARVGELLRAVNDMPHLEACGLMTMAPYSDDPEQSRPIFRDLRQLRDDLRAAGHGELDKLSMGMTQDFGVAIEEGATLVRIGTAIYAE
ncbi:YggS family pyridoxal phosphate-dependent enzyme [Candidatus Sumerlaeota bacterium]